LRRIQYFPLHPLLWALFPPLALLGNNISHIQPISTIRSVLVSVLLAVLVMGAAGLIYRNWSKASVIATSFVFLFFSYGHLYNLIQNRTLFGLNVGRHRVLFPLFILVWIAIIIWVSRAKNLSALAPALNLIGVLALVFPLYQIIAYEAKSSLNANAPAQNGALADVTALHSPSGTTPPDIYYIILDTYTRQDTLSQFFNYDNSAFLSALQNKGFYVAGCSQSNYPFTAVSLATSLNFNYPQTISPHLSPDNKNLSDVYPYLAHSAVVTALHQQGYRFVALESGYSPTEFKLADTYYSPTNNWQKVLLGDGINSFESMQLNSSAGMLFYEFNSYLPSPLRTFLSAYVLHRERMLYEMSMLDQMASVPGPKFVFVHILAPHNPFVFGPNGEPIERKTPFTLNDDRDVVTMQDYVAGYRDQVNYLDQRMLAIADALIQHSSVPPIIILQGDHGVPRLPEWDHTILNAYYLPAGGASALYPTISPVNTFRVIFNQYFGGQLPILPDQACNADPNVNPYACPPVTDPNPQCIAASGAQKP
jgi:hypothetical protein